MEDKPMRRLIVLVAALTLALWIAGDAFTQEGDEFVLPPVKLKPDRPSKTKPIPPTDDERETSEEAEAEEAEVPEEAESEEPAEAPEGKSVEEETAAPAEEVKEPAEEGVLEEEWPVEEESLAPPPEAEEPSEPAITEEEVIETPTAAEEETAEEVATPAEVAAPPTPLVPPEKPRRPEEIQAEAIEAQIEPEPEQDLTGMSELGLAEEVVRLRKAYGRALLALKDYYLKQGTQHKLEWIDAELAAFEKVPKTGYLTIAEVAGPELKPIRRIAAADQLFTEGMNYKDYPAFPPGKKDYLKTALQKFQTIIEKYPQSDKIDDAAFRMGEIYGGWYFQDWARAVQAYERSWQWNPQTEHPARFNAAKIYEEKLKNRIKAVELYNAVIMYSQDPDKVKQAQERIKALTGK